MISEQKIIEFIKSKIGGKPLANTDVNSELGIAGDDFSELMEKYAEEFKVDMTNYLWYFHHEEEGFMSIGAFFFKPPNFRVKRIPVTPVMLTDFANSGKWTISYPNHQIPTKRIDFLINKAIVVAVSFLLIWLCLKKILYLLK